MDYSILNVDEESCELNLDLFFEHFSESLSHFVVSSFQLSHIKVVS